MPRSRTLAAALVGGLALLGAACGGSATAKSADATAAASAKKAATATTAAGAGSAVSADPGSMPADGARPAGGDDGPGDDGGGPGRGGPGGPGGFGDLAAAATAIGISETDLRTAVSGGQTIAQVAATKGVSVDTVVAAMVTAMKAHFEPEVASGEHTQAEVDQILAGATAQMAAVANGQQPAFGPGGDGDHGGDNGGPGGDDGGSTAGSGGRKANTGKSSSTVGA